MKVLPVVLAVAAIVAIGCGQVSQIQPAPEVEITWVNPLTGTITQGSGGSFLTVDTVKFTVHNYVDAIVTILEIGYFDSDGENEVSPKLPPVNMHLYLPGDLKDTTTLLGIPVPISQTLVDYIYQTNDFALARLYFSGEDAYGFEKEFDVEFDWAIWKLD